MLKYCTECKHWKAHKGVIIHRCSMCILTSSYSNICKFFTEDNINLLRKPCIECNSRFICATEQGKLPVTGVNFPAFNSDWIRVAMKTWSERYCKWLAHKLQYIQITTGLWLV